MSELATLLPATILQMDEDVRSRQVTESFRDNPAFKLRNHKPGTWGEALSPPEMTSFWRGLLLPKMGERPTM